jgi:hypothetical protein
MIYAMLSEDIEEDVRKEIADAILNSCDVHNFVKKGCIVHIADVEKETEYFCIYCRDLVFPSSRNPKSPVPRQNWYFEHDAEGSCMGSDFGLKDDLTNPRRQGCYKLRGHEINSVGNPSDKHRTSCKTIKDGSTYCHLAVECGCVPGTPQPNQPTADQTS